MNMSKILQNKSHVVYKDGRLEPITFWKQNYDGDIIFMTRFGKFKFTSYIEKTFDGSYSYANPVFLKSELRSSIFGVDEVWVIVNDIYQIHIALPKY